MTTPSIEPVDGRVCGPCFTCCVALRIETPEFRKPSATRCSHLDGADRCGIYETRYPICRSFFCGYRRTEMIHPALRPDASGVLVRLRGGPSDPRGNGPLNANFTILRPEGLEAEGLVESISAAVKAEMQLYISVPSPPGSHPAVADVGDMLLFPVLAKNAEAIRAVLREIYEELAADPRLPIVRAARA